MAWKILSGPFAMTTRRRVVASALIYGLTITIRLTSPAGEDTKTPAHAAQSDAPPRSIMASDIKPAFREPSLISAQPIAFHRDWQLTSRACIARSERAVQLASVPDCTGP